MDEKDKTRATTVLCLKKENSVFMIADSQVSRGSFIVKHNAKKIKRINKNILVGIAGSPGDAFTIIDRLEKKLKDFSNLNRACYELMKEWRTDRAIRHLEAELIVADTDSIFVLSGDGVILEPEEQNIASIGSGSLFALSAATALYKNTSLSIEEIGVKSMEIASNLCIYTNNNFTIEKL